MHLRSRLGVVLSAFLALNPLAAGDSLPLYTESLTPLPIEYPGKTFWDHDTGAETAGGWTARARIDSAGYLIRRPVGSGELLPEGIFEYIFELSMLPGTNGGFLQKTNDVIRIEAWDATTHERLISRTFQKPDFPNEARDTVSKTLLFSTDGRAGHLFEPRVYWPGLRSVCLRQIKLISHETPSPVELRSKAIAFEASMGERYLQNGFVLARRTNGDYDDYGDTAIWTGLYAAAESWRYQATHDRKARERMETSLWALHRLCEAAPTQGTLVRFTELRPDTAASASRDSYTGFLFALAQALPWVRDPKLKKALLGDAQKIGTHFLDHDLMFQPAQGEALDLNPYPSRQRLQRGIEQLLEMPGVKRQMVTLLEGVRIFVLLRRRPHQKVERGIQHLEKLGTTGLENMFLPFLQETLNTARRMESRDGSANTVERLLGSEQNETAEGKWEALLQKVVSNFGDEPPERALSKLSDVNVLAAPSLHALHFLKVLGETLPKPNRFDALYRANLWREKRLLQTLIMWDNVDDYFLEALFGHTGAAVRRNATRHISFLALYDLIDLEKDPAIRQCYRAVFEEEFLPMQEDQNAMLHVMRSKFAMRPEQTGVGFWSLAQYSNDRRGTGERYWNDRRRALASRHGGQTEGQAVDPVFVGERQRDTFIWQRSARSLGGDDDDKFYPPLDYLFVYWLAEKSGSLQ